MSTTYHVCTSELLAAGMTAEHIAQAIQAGILDPVHEFSGGRGGLYRYHPRRPRASERSYTLVRGVTHPPRTAKV